MKDTFTLLRLPFSYFLMPVYFFGMSQAKEINVMNAVIIFVVLHLFIFPSSNAYNSYMDKDEGPIGGLKNPPKPTKQLYYVANALDLSGLVLSAFVNLPFFIGTLIYILSSRAYSYKGIRLKKYPVGGFLIVAGVQGGVTFLAVILGLSNHLYNLSEIISLLPAIVASALLLGGVYPLTQIFQHAEDKKSGDISISLLLGYRGTFIFSALLFVAANVILFFYFQEVNELMQFNLLQLFLLPTVIFFLYWAFSVFKDVKAASFEKSLIMNIISATCMNACFITCTILN